MGEEPGTHVGPWEVLGLGAPASSAPGPSQSTTIVYSSDVSPQTVASNATLIDGRIEIGPNDTGVYATATVFSHRPELFAWTSRPAVRRIYWTQTSRGPVIATHPRVVARLAKTFDARPVEPSMDYVRSVILWGYPIDGTTPYRGVNMLGINELLHADRNQVRVAALRRAQRNLDGDANEHEKAALLVDAIIASIDRIPEDQIPLLRLSGGKDSRVLLAALASMGRKAVAQTRGQPRDAEVLIAGALAESVAMDHFIAGTPLSVPGDIRQSVLDMFVRTGGFMPSESHQSPYIGADPMVPGQTLLVGQSHVQRGGFARTMKTDALAVMYGQASRHVGSDLATYARSYVDQWSRSNWYETRLEQLYEFHVQHRASTYLTAHFVDYSRDTSPVYPMIDARFVAICDQLTMFDKVSERVIYLAAQQMTPEVVRIPLSSGNWRFNPSIVDLDQFLVGRKAAELTYSTYEAPPDPHVSTYSSSSVTRIVEELTNAASYSELRPLLHSKFASRLERVAGEGLEAAFDAVDGRSLMEEKKFIWRLYNAALWLEHFDTWA